jgi:putative glycosyltransferase (TIGR04372 family)
MKELLTIKIKAITKELLVYLFGIPAALLIRLLYPLIHIRVGILPADRIGHLAEISMHFSCTHDLYENKRILNLFFLSCAPANTFFLKLIKRKLHIYRFVQFIYKANLYLPGSAIFYNVDESGLYANYEKLTRDTQNLRKKTKQAFPFSVAEDICGNSFLKKMGCSNNKYVCLNIRDSAYLEQTFPNRDNSYHDYRDSDCQSYALAVNELISRGYFVIRMGSLVKDKMLIDSDQFLDYPFCELSSDFLDIWLMANCTFCISTSSGLDSVADIYRRPIAYVNALPFGDFNSSNPKTIWMPKTIVDKNNQAIPLEDIITSGIISFHESEDLNKYDWHEVDNTDEEICEVAKEIEEKVAGIWDPSKDNTIQKQHVLNLLSTHWDEFTKYHNINAFKEKSYGHFSETFLNKISK